MKQIYFVFLIIFSLLVGCAPSLKETVKTNKPWQLSERNRNLNLHEEAVRASDSWWTSTRNEDPNFYTEIDLGKAIFHLCGSREKLADMYNTRYPHTPYDPTGRTYMFTAGPDPDGRCHTWLVVKSRDGKAVLHKWAAGHELIRILWVSAPNKILRANEYE